MKKIIMMVLIVLLLLGGIVGGLYFWGIDPLALAGLKKGDLQAKAKEAAAKAASVIPVIPPSYVDFGLLVVPVIQNHEVKSQAELVIRLQVPANKVEPVATFLPRLQAALLEEMMEYVPKLLQQDGSLDPDKLSARMVEVGARVFGPGVIQAVIIENMMMHQL